jgi:hypothetical protein
VQRCFSLEKTTRTNVALQSYISEGELKGPAKIKNKRKVCKESKAARMKIKDKK